jgi:hypothetical protein
MKVKARNPKSEGRKKARIERYYCLRLIIIKFALQISAFGLRPSDFDLYYPYGTHLNY